MKRRPLELVVCLVACLVALGAACGSTPPPPKPVAAAPDLPALPRSSIAAVLLHRDELKLTDEQVKGLQEIDEQLAERAKAISDRPSGGPRPDGGVAAQGGRGGGLHMTGGRGGGGRGMAGGGYRGTPSGTPKGSRSPQERMDDADTRAYLQAEEEILAPEQRDRAREIAEKYREDLYDRRSRSGSGSGEGDDK